MSSYFDEATREVAEAAERFERDEGFLQACAEIEERVYRKVTLVTGDREFPDDLRERILSAFAVQSIRQHGDEKILPPPARAVEYVLATRGSQVIDSVHELFHELARRGTHARFGWLSDSPTQILMLRDEWDGQRSCETCGGTGFVYHERERCVCETCGGGDGA